MWNDSVYLMLIRSVNYVDAAVAVMIAGARPEPVDKAVTDSQ